MKKIIFLILLTTFVIVLASVETQAQYRSKKGKRSKYRFNAGFVLGANFSQIHGDHFSGFDKMGFRAGVKGIIYLNKKLDINTGISFVQRGSRFEDSPSGILSRDKNRKIHLDYVEVPFFLTYKKLDKTGRGFRYDFGGSFARLFNSEVKELITPYSETVSYESLQEQFQKNEFNFLVGVNYFVNSRIGLGIQSTVQLNKLYNDLDYVYNPRWFDTYKEVKHMRNYQVGLHLTYHIF